MGKKKLIFIVNKLLDIHQEQKETDFKNVNSNLNTSKNETTYISSGIVKNSPIRSRQGWEVIFSR